VVAEADLEIKEYMRSQIINGNRMVPICKMRKPEECIEIVTTINQFQTKEISSQMRIILLHTEQLEALAYSSRFLVEILCSTKEKEAA
jgi:hypothetical protein